MCALDKLKTLLKETMFERKIYSAADMILLKVATNTTKVTITAQMLK